MKTDPEILPVAIIGAGPVGLAAAAHLLERGEPPLILEAGPSVGHSVRQWGHVRMFSPWRYNIDPASRRLLETVGWDEPCGEKLPTGSEIVDEYLQPLAEVCAIAEALRLGHRVTAVTREGLDKVRSHGRAERPFVIRTLDAAGAPATYRARAVIDASGTWRGPNPMGADGLRVPGEEAFSSRIDYGIPDLAGAREEDFAGARVLVVGSGHSSFNAVLDLLRVKETHPATTITWAMRKAQLGNVFGGGAADALPERGELGQKVRRAVDSGAVTLLHPMAIEGVTEGDGDTALRVQASVGGEGLELPVDRIVVATGFRPDFAFSREIRLRLDPALECAEKLGPLIDPNEHSCGSVPPHGAKELAHPEPGYYVVGMKSYGRAPTFLLATGYEQVRSVVAEIAGDPEAAARVELALPETGVCSLNEAPQEVAPSCGGEPQEVDPSPSVSSRKTSCCG
ncbi:MAG: lysine N(6)-hydroxylase/L-ornithine N(5)-oxygenase family protein [Verrucomicrobiales bacterium]|nr:lysine N(6)-hydroxylase/L-ornithine N(5)-oxygenase family protein [Verrucomicrobiales bacterium]